jgi:hypothetical protein
VLNVVAHPTGRAALASPNETEQSPFAAYTAHSPFYNVDPNDLPIIAGLPLGGKST